MNTIEPEITNLRIHIAPVGYEIDRIVLPAKKMKADKMFLLVHENPSTDKATKFYSKIEKKLEKLNIDVVKEYHNRLDLFKIIKSVKEIIEREKQNIVYVNLASGSKIQSIACMMACQMFNDNSNVHPFYVEAKEYLGFSGEPISTGIRDIQQVPTYEIQRPVQKLVTALQIIQENDGKISKKEMAKFALEKKIISVQAENMSQATFASLDKNIISPLENEWGFIRVEKVGRTRWIHITSEGQNAAEFLI
ncbi:hypothetical protein SCCGRSA3_02039 [Marine Group I thaumarchaeote SCGC RSA3]|uniref:Uncharacterized protein n=2 Tax=Marine Group I TaxID=905826 RepID=A0A081RMX7_9ARCH|nr:hypothetical protein AAA799N04_01042 [Marine Group I thaumarchaeote SCGC AAA799-N04]KFM16836.1 hypothetical protein SCCGRSA3_02039 [Marine Group I thaumarchaeote SCGC RSA3]